MEICTHAALEQIVLNQGILYLGGNIKNKTLQQFIEENSRNRFIQAIRTIGPVKMMQLIGENTSIFKSQCAACHTMTSIKNVVQRFEEKLTENPEVLDSITRTRELSGDHGPYDHLSDF